MRLVVIGVNSCREAYLPNDRYAFLFWLKSTAQKEYSFYGQKPIPATVSQIVESELNATLAKHLYCTQVVSRVNE